MKIDKFLTFCVALLTACLLSFGAMGSLISGFDLPVGQMELLYAIWTGGAVLCCGLFLTRRGGLSGLLLVLAALVCLWPNDSFQNAVRALITRLTTAYDGAYGCGVIDFPEIGEWKNVPLDLLLGFWGCLIAGFAGATVLRGRNLLLTLAMGLLPVAATVVVTDTPADMQYLFLVILAVILLVMTGSVRRQSVQRGSVLMCILLVPVTLLLAGLFYLFPQDTYVNQAEAYSQTVSRWWESRYALFSDNTGLIRQEPATPNVTATANLNDLGSRRKNGRRVMEVEADFTDTVYLRAQDFDVYDGASWDASIDRTESFGVKNWTWKEGVYGNLTIHTIGKQSKLFLPYYSTLPSTLSGGRLENTDGRYTYMYALTDAPVGRQPGILDTTPYIQLPETTRKWAEAYLRQVYAEAGLRPDIWLSSDGAAKIVGDYVRNSARYSLNPSRMTGDAQDFVQWFLEEADSGYCVHFATAAAVLLRAMEIPARYVTGYAFQVKAGETTVVTSDRAHAWVEYYDEAWGVWRVLEVTPPDLGQEEETEPTETHTAPPPPTTEPEVTEPVTKPQQEIQRPSQQGGDTSVDENSQKIQAMKQVIPAVMLVMPVQRRVRIRRRRRAHAPNARALARWQEVELICHACGKDVPEELEALAQKAKFSQHTLTAEEVKTFDTWLKTGRKELKKLPFWKRLFCRYVLAL